SSGTSSGTSAGTSGRTSALTSVGTSALASKPTTSTPTSTASSTPASDPGGPSMFSVNGPWFVAVPSTTTTTYWPATSDTLTREAAKVAPGAGSLSLQPRSTPVQPSSTLSTVSKPDPTVSNSYRLVAGAVQPYARSSAALPGWHMAV